MISWVKILPSKGAIQFKNSTMRRGFLIVVEKDKGFLSGALSLLIISYKNLLTSVFYCVIIKTDIVAFYWKTIIFI